MIYILFFTIFYGNGSSSFTAEFNTQKHCEAAAAAHAARMSTFWKPVYYATCNPKGLPQ